MFALLKAIIITNFFKAHQGIETNYSVFKWALDMLYDALKKNKAATVSIVYLPTLQVPMHGFWSNVP